MVAIVSEACFDTTAEPREYFDGTAIRVVEANRATEEGETPRVSEGGLVVRVQLRGVQPSADTKTAGAVCISAAKALTAALERRTTAPCGPALPIFSD